MIRMCTTTIPDGTVYDKDRYHKKVTEEIKVTSPLKIRIYIYIYISFKIFIYYYSIFLFFFFSFKFFAK
jgi:hypothetical protein